MQYGVAESFQSSGDNFFMVQRTFCDLNVLNVKQYSASVVDIRVLRGEWLKGARVSFQRGMSGVMEVAWTSPCFIGSFVCMCAFINLTFLESETAIFVLLLPV